MAKNAIAIELNSLVIKQNTNKHINNQKHIYQDWVTKLNCNIEFFLPHNRHQNCLDKSLKLFQIFSNVYFQKFCSKKLDKKNFELHQVFVYNFLC